MLRFMFASGPQTADPSGPQLTLSAKVAQLHAGPDAVTTVGSWTNQRSGETGPYLKWTIVLFAWVGNERGNISVGSLGVSCWEKEIP